MGLVWVRRKNEKLPEAMILPLRQQLVDGPVEGFSLESRGAGAYPENWGAFLGALRRLIGGREFG